MQRFSGAFLRVSENNASPVCYGAGLARIGVLLYLLVLPFSHNATLKYVGLAGMLMAVVWSWHARLLVWDWRSPVLRSVLFVFGVFVLSSLLGPAPGESLHELRKHFLPGLLLLALIPSYFRRPQEVGWLLTAALVPFVLRGGLALGELAAFGDLDRARQSGYFLKGFSMDATLYAPLFVGALLSMRGVARCWVGIGGLIVLAAMVVAQSRAPLIAALVCGGAMLIALRIWRGLFGGLMLLAVGALVLVLWQPAVAHRFASIFDAQTYAGAQGMSARTPIWRGVIEVSRDRPWLGHGFGWKKLGRTAVEGGYVNHWQSLHGDPYAEAQAWYFALPTDTVNPHNLPLLLFFEGGGVGLGAYAVMFVVLLWFAWRLSRQGEGDYPILAAMALGYLCGHVVLSMFDGLWLGVGPTFAIIALLEVCRQQGREIKQEAPMRVT